MENILKTPLNEYAGKIKMIVETLRLCLAANNEVVDKIPLECLELAMQLLLIFNYPVNWSYLDKKIHRFLPLWSFFFGLF